MSSKLRGLSAIIFRLLELIQPFLIWVHWKTGSWSRMWEKLYIREVLLSVPRRNAKGDYVNILGVTERLRVRVNSCHGILLFSSTR